jgi:hypothetical protein
VSVSAGVISVSQTLELLDKEHEGFARGVADGRYMFWLGSGISLNVVPGLPGVVEAVLVHLQKRMGSDSGDRFRKALQEIIDEYAELTTEEQESFDIDVPVANWTHRGEIVQRLTQKYSLMLDVGVSGESADYLLWEGVKPAETYGNPTLPDAEHICLAILGLEGVVSVMASANWDGLVEAAMKQLTGNADSFLNAVVLQQDLRSGSTPVQLLKFHGCAVQARSGGTEYRDALVGRQSQISGWPNSGSKAAVRNKMVVAATENRTFMIGFSAQDANIQEIFAAVKSALPWPWPSDPPAVVFAEDRLGPWQKQVAQITYGDAEFSAHRDAVLAASLVRAYGKPLLTALVLDVLARKAQALIRSTGHLDDDAKNGLCAGVTALRDAVALAAKTGTKDFIDTLLAVMGRAVSLFLRGEEPDCPTTYERLTMLPASQVSSAPSVESDGVRELAISLGILGGGLIATSWSLDIAPTTDNTAGALRVTQRDGGQRALAFASSGRAAIELVRKGPFAATASDWIVIHCDDPAEPLARSPSAPPGRTGSVNRGYVSIRQLLRDSTDLRSLERNFRLQSGLKP